MEGSTVSRPGYHAHDGHANCNSHSALTYPRLMQVMAKVSFVGLAILAYSTSASLFVPAFVTGTFYGLYERCGSGQQSAKGVSFGGCSQGLWEDFAGVKFPLPVALLAGVAAAAVHIDHHPWAFVPLAGFAFGAWAGSACAPVASLCFYKFRKLVNA
jgi:hypothetical protein